MNNDNSILVIKAAFPLFELIMRGKLDGLTMSFKPEENEKEKIILFYTTERVLGTVCIAHNMFVKKSGVGAIVGCGILMPVYKLSVYTKNRLIEQTSNSKDFIKKFDTFPVPNKYMYRIINPTRFKKPIHIKLKSGVIFKIKITPKIKKWLSNKNPV